MRKRGLKIIASFYWLWTYLQVDTGRRKVTIVEDHEKTLTWDEACDGLNTVGKTHDGVSHAYINLDVSGK